MKAFLLAGASLLGVAYGVSHIVDRPADRKRRQGNWPRLLETPRAPARFPAEGDDATAETARAFLMYFVVPLWIAAGSADALCHRRAHIETTSGPKESVLHILMLVEVGIPLLAALFLEVTSPVLALLIASFILHEITAFWDVSYAVKRRAVTPLEQHVHSFLEMIPFMAASVLTILHWKQFLSLVGIKPEPRDFEIRLKKRPVPLAYSLGLIGSVTVLEWLPYIFEFIRGVRAKRLSSPGRAATNHADMMPERQLPTQPAGNGQ